MRPFVFVILSVLLLSLAVQGKSAHKQAHGKKHASGKHKIKQKQPAGSKHDSFNMEEEMQKMKKVKPVSADSHNVVKKHKKAHTKVQIKGASEKKQVLGLEEHDGSKKFEEDENSGASTMVNEVITMVGACKHPSTWCTSSLSQDEQTKLNDASSLVEKTYQKLKASPTADLKKEMNKNLDMVNSILPQGHKLSHKFRWSV